MAGDPFELNIELAAGEPVASYVRGMTMVGCLKHDQIVWSPLSKNWKCPVCGYQPPSEAERSCLTVKSVDYKRGTITVG
jgi:hypothetical protein